MRPINLLPPEVARQRQRRRRVALLIAAAVAYVAVLAVGVLIWNGRIDTARRNLDTQVSFNQTLERQVVALSDSGNLRDDFNARADLVRAALETDVDWGIILNDLARLLPPRLWVETFSGTVVPATQPGIVGQVAFSGIGFDFPDVSAWLRELDSEQFNGITGTWVSTVSDGALGDSEVVRFTSTAVLTDAAATNRADELIPEVP
jgi:Tfp pilus assembly protein PilN